MNLVRNLLINGAIETTRAKAPAVKRLTDKLIGQGKSGTLMARRLVESFFGTRQMANRVVDEVAPAMGDRVSGFTTTMALGKRRGDNAEMVRVALVNPVPARKVEETKKEVTKKSEAKKSEAKEVKATKVVKKVAKKTTKKAEKEVKPE